MATLRTDKTETLGIPLPNPNNFLENDVIRIRAAFEQIDGFIAKLNKAVESVGTYVDSGKTVRELVSPSEFIIEGTNAGLHRGDRIKINGKVCEIEQVLEDGEDIDTPPTEEEEQPEEQEEEQPEEQEEEIPAEGTFMGMSVKPIADAASGASNTITLDMTQTEAAAMFKAGEVLKFASASGEETMVKVVEVVDDGSGKASLKVSKQVTYPDFTIWKQTSTTSGGKSPQDCGVIGVCDDGTRSVNGMGLKWIDLDFNTVDSLPEGFFDAHPSYQFTGKTIGTNEFRRIPICYTRRGTVPSGPNAGKWYMQLSPDPRDGFEPHLTAFMYKEQLKDCFYWGTYRASLDNRAKPTSQPDKLHWKNIFYNDAVVLCERLGQGYHLGSIQEYHEILMRAVIERKTFDLWPVADRRNYQKNHYRGIEEMAYDNRGIDFAGLPQGTSAEWRSGIRTNANAELEVFDQQGNWGYNYTGEAPKIDSQYITSLLTGTHFDHLLIASTGTNDQSASMIPDYNRTATPGHYCYVSFHSDLPGCGAFNSCFCKSGIDSDEFLGFRLAYIQ